MKESSQAEEKLWWIELESVKKPSREAPHPSRLELQFHLKPSVNKPSPQSAGGVVSCLYPLPSVAEYTSGQCPVKMCQINERIQNSRIKARIGMLK